MRFFFGFLRNGNSSVREIDLILFWFSCEIPSYSATKTGVVFFFRKLLGNVVSFKVFYTKEYNVDVYCFFVKGKLHMQFVDQSTDGGVAGNFVYQLKDKRQTIPKYKSRSYRKKRPDNVNCSFIFEKSCPSISMTCVKGGWNSKATLVKPSHHILTQLLV